MGLFDSLRSLVTVEKRLNVEARFELLREAVTGTMSSFHMARDKKTREVFGLKVLDAEKTGHFEARFKGLHKPSEGEIAMAIVHPRVVKTLEFGTTTKGEPYILSEFLEGSVLSQMIMARDPALGENRLELVRQMAEGVAAVHAAGFIHRDVCPRNFIVSPDAASLKLIDFGLTLPMKKEFMQPGNRTGTPTYLAPEIARRRPTDHRVDIFSMGVSVYYLLSFDFPWPSHEATGKVALRHDTQPPTDLREALPGVNERLAAAVMRCISISADDRFASAEQFLTAIRAVDSVL